jgi:hypothetical protein
LIFLDMVDEKFKNIILKTGKILYERESDWIFFRKAKKCFWQTFIKFLLI